jgi:hypothetical protein
MKPHVVLYPPATEHDTIKYRLGFRICLSVDTLVKINPRSIPVLCIIWPFLCRTQAHATTQIYRQQIESKYTHSENTIPGKKGNTYKAPRSRADQNFINKQGCTMARKKRVSLRVFRSNQTGDVIFSA